MSVKLLNAQQDYIVINNKKESFMNDQLLQKFTVETLEFAYSQWIDSAIELDLPSFEAEKIFSYARDHIDYDNKESSSFSYAIYSDDAKECLAVVDIIVSNNNPQRKYIKMLTVDMSPRLMNIIFSEQMENIDEISAVYLKAIKGTVLLTLSHKADIIKLYGRSLPIRLLLKSLESSINAENSFNVSTAWEGHWFSIFPNKQRK